MSRLAAAALAVCGTVVLVGTPAFLHAPPHAELSHAPAATAGQARAPAASASAQTVTALAIGVACGLAAAAAAGKAVRSNRTAAKYTTQQILPAFTWAKSGFKSSDLDGGVLEAVCLQNVDVVLGKTESGQLFAVADKCPPTGTSLCIGGEIRGDTVVDGQYGTVFNVFTGFPEEWCPSPPIIGGIVGSIMGGPQFLQTFEVRTSLFGGDVEVLVDVNMRKAYEADYWKGLLDAQGKDDGTYY